ncbi:DUF6481 family protein [Sphingomonas sp. CJ20]
MSYKIPTFQDRAALSAEAKKKALEKLRAKAPMDPAVVAERRAAQEARDAEIAAKSAAKKAAIEEAKAAKKAAAEEKAAKEAARAAARIPPTAAELKAIRDARYAARKARAQG